MIDGFVGSRLILRTGNNVSAMLLMLNIMKKRRQQVWGPIVYGDRVLARSVRKIIHRKKNLSISFIRRRSAKTGPQDGGQLSCGRLSAAVCKA